MKPLSILCSIAVLLAGCADPMEKRNSSEVQEQLERGVTGQGQLGPIDRQPGDPANEHGVPQSHP